MSSIPEEDVHATSSVARQVFPEAIPIETAQESETKDDEDIRLHQPMKEKKKSVKLCPLPLN